MPLVPQRLVIPMQSGLDESTDAYVAEASRLLRLENAEWRARGATRKRYGFTPLTQPMADGTDMTNVRTMFATGAELCVVSDTSVCALDEVQGVWLRRPGYVSPFVEKIDTVVRDGTSCPQCDIDQIPGGWRVLATTVYAPIGGASPSHVFGATMSIYCDNGQTLTTREVFGIGSDGPHCIRAAHVGTKLLTLWMDSVTAPCNIAGKYFDTATNTSGNTGNLATDCDTSAGSGVLKRGKRLFDAIGSAHEPKLFLAYIREADGYIVVKRIDETFATTHTLEISDHAPYTRVAICESDTGDRVYIAGFGPGTGEAPATVIDVTRANRSDLASQWNTVIKSPVTWVDASALTDPSVENMGVAEGFLGATQKVLVTWAVRSGSFVSWQAAFCSTSGTGVSSSRWVYNQCPMTRPWFDSTTGTAYITAALDNPAGEGGSEFANIFASNSLAIITDVGDLMSDAEPLLPNVAGHHHYGVAPYRRQDVGAPGPDGEGSSGNYFTGNCANVVTFSPRSAFGTTKVAYAAPVRVFSTPGGDWDDRWGVDVVTLDSTGNIGAAAVFSRCAAIGGALVTWYDGARAFELGHLHAPRLWAIDITTTLAGGALEDVACTLSASYESRDASGALHRGPPTGASNAHTPTAGDNAIGFDTFTTFATNRDNGLSFIGGSGNIIGHQLTIVPYRSSDGGSLVRILPAATVYSNKVTPEGVGTTTRNGQLYDLGTSDADPLYVLSGELEAAPATPAAYPWVLNERLWLSQCARRDEAWPSKRFYVQSGVRVAPELHESLAIHSPSEEQVVAVFPLNGSTIILTSSKTYAMDGLGPDDAGQGSDWGQLRLISADVGCLDARSVVVTPAGGFWQGQSGMLQLLDTSMALRPIGEAVRDETDAYPVITSGVLVSAKYQVRWTQTNDAGDEGQILVFDYRIGAWAVWTPQKTVDDVTTKPAWIGAALFNNTYYVCTADGLVAKEDPTAYYDTLGDANTWVSHALETGHCKVAGLGGFVRAWAWFLHLRRATAHKVVAEVFADAQTTPNRTITWTDAQIQTLPELPLEELRAELARQLAQSQKIRFYDLPPSDDIRDWGTGEGFVCTGIVLEYGVQPRSLLFPKSARS